MERIREKLDFSKERLLILSKAMEEGIKSELEKFGVYKIFQELCESLFDAIAIFIKSKGIEPKDRYSNIEILCELKTISREEARILIEANGLRNLDNSQV